MKKIFTGVFVLLGICFISMFSMKTEVKAEVEQVVISEEREISGDIDLQGITGDAFVIKSNARLVVSNSKISASGEGITNVFHVEEGGELVLNNVTIDYNLKGRCGIYNEGCIELNGAFFSNGLEYSVYQESAEENSFKLIQGSFVKGIYLAEGYITLTEDSEISSKINIEVESCGDDPLLLVDTIGENVFANKWIDMFEISVDQEDSVKCLDYIAQDIPDGKTDANGNKLSSGDLVIATYSSSEDISKGLLKLGDTKYTTGRYYLEYFKEQEVTLKNLSSGKYMNNLDCVGGNYQVNECEAFTTLEIQTNCNEEDITSKTYTYPSGSDWGIFVDIPSGMKLEGEPQVSTSALRVTNICTNSKYLRCRIEYIAEELEGLNAVISFNFSEEKEYGNITIAKEPNVQVTHPQSMEVGSSYTIDITKSEDCTITHIYFNDKDIYEDGVFVYDLKILKENNLRIESYTSVEIEPKIFNVVYGDEVKLSQSVYVPSMASTIQVTFVVGEEDNVGGHKIEGVVCEDSQYHVYLAPGSWVYNITHKEISLGEVEYKESVEITYSDAFELSADLFVTYLPDYLICSASLVSTELDVGTQPVNLTFSTSNSNYTLIEDTLEVYLKITPQKITSTKCEVTNLTPTYDGTLKSVQIDGLERYLLATVKYFQQDIEKNPIDAGEYEVEISFLPTTKLYSCTLTLTKTLNILQRSISVVLEQPIFEYTGSTPILKGIPEGVLNNDEVGVVLEDVSAIDAGDYNVKVLGLSNANYIATTTLLPFTIQATKLDDELITFSDTPVFYDTKPHMPVMTSTLPQYITYHFEEKECINVGEYYVKCSFVSTNKNVEAPGDKYARVVIEPREITVTFKEPEDMVANGERKYISVEVHNALDKVNYEMIYDGDCILPGRYTCTVVLTSPSNYVITNTPTYTFNILRGTTSYITEDINITLNGTFHPDKELEIKDISRTKDVVGMVADMQLSSYMGIRLNTEASDSIQVTIQAHKVRDYANVRLYTMEDGKLNPIDYTLEDGVICFKIDGPQDILLVELKETNTLLISLLILLPTLSAIVLLFCLKHTRKRKQVEYFILHKSMDEE